MSTSIRTTTGRQQLQRMSEVTRAFLTKAGIVAGVLCLVALAMYFSDQSCSNPFFVEFDTWCIAPR